MHGGTRRRWFNVCSIERQEQCRNLVTEGLRPYSNCFLMDLSGQGVFLLTAKGGFAVRDRGRCERKPDAVKSRGGR